MPKELSAGEKVIRTIVREELKNFATKDEMNSKFNDVMNKLDMMYGFLKKDDEEISVIHHHDYKIQDPKLENHEKRITKLEVQIA